MMQLKDVPDLQVHTIPRVCSTVYEAEPHKDRSRVATYESLSIDYVGQQCIITYYGVPNCVRLESTSRYYYKVSALYSDRSFLTSGWYDGVI